jgi:hypothetical protein
VDVSIWIGQNLWIGDAVTDSAGGAFVVVVREEPGIDEDNQYMQHLSPGGERLWGERGILFRDTTYLSYSSQAVPDLQGGVIVAWTDARYGLGNNDIFLQHIDSSGNCLWHWNGVPFLSTYGIQWSSIMQEAISDGEGGGIWFMTTTLSQYNQIVFVRLDYDGHIVWENQNVGPYCLREITSMLHNPYDNHYWALSSEARQGINNPQHPYVYRIDANGNLTFPIGLRVGNTQYTQQNESMGINNYGVNVCYQDRRLESQGIFMVYSQAIDSTGQFFWNYPDGTLTMGMNQFDYWFHDLNIFTNGLNGCVLTASYASNGVPADLVGGSVHSDGTLGGPFEILPIIETIGNDIRLSWQSIVNATGYNIYFSSQPYLFPTAPDTTVTDTSFIDIDGLIENEKYYRITFSY